MGKSFLNLLQISTTIDSILKIIINHIYLNNERYIQKIIQLIHVVSWITGITQKNYMKIYYIFQRVNNIPEHLSKLFNHFCYIRSIIHGQKKKKKTFDCGLESVCLRKMGYGRH